MSVTSNETLRCPICDKLFFAKRKDARFCSAKCRQQAHRKGISGKGRNPEQAVYGVVEKGLYNLAALDKQNSIKTLVLLGLELLTEDNKKKVFQMLREYPFDEK
jgi:hypothetical protein